MVLISPSTNVLYRVFFTPPEICQEPHLVSVDLLILSDMEKRSPGLETTSTPISSPISSDVCFRMLCYPSAGCLVSPQETKLSVTNGVIQSRQPIGLVAREKVRKDHHFHLAPAQP